MGMVSASREDRAVQGASLFNTMRPLDAMCHPAACGPCQFTAHMVPVCMGSRGGRLVQQISEPQRQCCRGQSACARGLQAERTGQYSCCVHAC